MPNTDILEKLDLISNNLDSTQNNYDQFIDILKDIVLDSDKGKELVISAMRKKGINISEEADYNIISDTISGLAINGGSNICNLTELFTVVHKTVDNKAAVTEKFGGMSLLFEMNSISDSNSIEKPIEESEE